MSWRASSLRGTASSIRASWPLPPGSPIRSCVPRSAANPSIVFAGWARWAARAGGFSSDVVEIGRALSIGQHIATTLILIVPLLFLVRCWRLPFGAATLMFTTTAFGLSAMEALEGGEMVLSALLGGLGTDLLVRVLRPSHERASLDRDRLCHDAHRSRRRVAGHPAATYVRAILGAAAAGSD
jgi:hypothetical protein